MAYALQNYYFSGQGSLLVATRNAVTGKPEGFVRIGNVPSLTIDIEVDKFEHKESETGFRLRDLTVIKEKKGKFTAKMESLSLKNLALGFYGETAAVVGATVSSEDVIAYLDKKCSLAYPGVSAVTVNAPAAPTFIVSHAYALNELVVPITPNGHYYKVTTAGTSAGTEPVWSTSGGAVTSGTAVFTDQGTTLKVLDTDYTLDATFGTIIPLSSGSIDEGDVIRVGYTYAGFNVMDAFTQSSAPERWFRIELTNTVDDTHVIIELFRAQIDPLTNYALINDEIASVDLTGALLADPLITSGSKFFRQINLGA